MPLGDDALRVDVTANGWFDMARTVRRADDVHARVMGTSVRMIERHYGALLDGAAAGIAARLDALTRPRAGSC